MALSVITSWDALIRQALHWSAAPTLQAASMLPSLIEGRLIELEASQAAVERWLALMPTPEAAPTEAG